MSIPFDASQKRAVFCTTFPKPARLGCLGKDAKRIVT
jgi:hypothetical protein